MYFIHVSKKIAHVRLYTLNPSVCSVSGTYLYEYFVKDQVRALTCVFHVCVCVCVCVC